MDILFNDGGRNEIIYKGDKTDVKVKSKKGEEPIICSHDPLVNDVNLKLWTCDHAAHNRIESKCAGDWWITSNKGCLSDGFTNFYQFIYLVIITTLVISSLYSTYFSANFYSYETFYPMIYVILTLFIYHIVYLFINFFVSWSHGESMLFQDFISEFLKGRKGYWTKDDKCDKEYKRVGRGETEYKTIWEKENAISKFKIIINIVLLIFILGYTVNYAGNKYIQKSISNINTLEGRNKNVYMIMITLLISFSVIQFLYLIYSTIMVDECVINRITEVTHKIDEPNHQKYCKGKIDSDEGNNLCKGKPSINDCKDDSENCIYDNSYTINELIRCQLDRHGGLFYHILILLFVPLIFVFIKLVNIGEYFK